MIVQEKGGYRVKSESGKNLSRVYKTRKEAEHRLATVEFFKGKIHLPKKGK